MAEQRRRPRRRPRDEEPKQEEQQEPEDAEDPEEPEEPEEPESVDEEFDDDESEDTDAAEEPDDDQRATSKSVGQVKKGTRTDTSATLEPLTNASAEDWLGSNQDPDVLLSIPNLGVDHIGIEVDNLRAHVELHAKVLDLLELHVGAQVSIEKVEIDIENVRVQAMLKVRLNEVYKIVDRVMTTIDKNPEILTNLTGGLGKGLEGALQGGTSDDDDGGTKSIEGKASAEYDETDEDDEDDYDDEDGDDDEEDDES